MLRTALAAVTLALSLQALAEESESAYPTHQCVASLYYDDRLLGIADKVALGRSDETNPGMFELERPATAAERSALELWSKLREFCYELGADFRREHADPNQTALAGRLFALHQALLGELRDGAITFGEFNRRRVETYLIAATLEAHLIERTEQVTPAAHSEI